MGEIRNKKMQLYLAAILILIFVLIFIYLIHPIQTKATEVQSELAGKEQESKSLQIRLAKLADIPDQDRIKLEQVRRQVPEQPYVETILRDLRRLEVVSKAQMKQYNIQVGNTVKTDANSKDTAAAVSGNVLPIQIETSFTGNYDQIYKLFKELESLDRLIQVDKMSFNVKQGPLVQINAPGGQIICSITLAAYYSPTLEALLKHPLDIDYSNPDGRSNPFN